MDIYVYRSDVYSGSTPPNVTNWDVESSDGERLGKIDEATYDDRNGIASGCLVWYDAGRELCCRRVPCPGELTSND